MRGEGRQRLQLVVPDRSMMDSGKGGAEGPASREIDWSILMARAQDGDTTAYLRLLQEIALRGDNYGGRSSGNYDGR